MPFLRKTAKSFGAAFGLNTLQYVLTDNQDKRCETPIDPKDRDVIQSAYAKVIKHQFKLSIRQQPKSWGGIAAASSLPLHSTYKLQISIDRIKQLNDQLGENKVPLSQAIMAVCAHEAVHANESHQFLVNFSSTLLISLSWSLTPSSLSPATRAFFTIGLASYWSLFLVKYLEYRADIQAANISPEYKDTTLKLLSASCKTHSHPSFLPHSFFEVHPSPEERIDNIMKHCHFSSKYSAK